MIRTRRLRTAPGIELDLREAGTPGDPVVLLLHGFPESAHSWRHQMAVLADSGHHVIAPDQRGYAGSSVPADIAAYSGDRLVDDACTVLDDVGADQAIVVGHDWGALVAWHLGATRPERCRAIIGVSVPYNTWPAPPTEVFRFLHGDRFFYITYFQTPGVAEAELDADPERFLRAMIWSASGDIAEPTLTVDLPMEGTTMIAAVESVLGGPARGLPTWITPDDFDHYVRQFRTSGFAGPVNWYRNFDVNYRRTATLGPERFTMPTAFIAGERDPVILGRTELIDRMAEMLPDFVAAISIRGAGHWVQQEAPDEFNEALLGLIAQLPDRPGS